MKYDKRQINREFQKRVARYVSDVRRILYKHLREVARTAGRIEIKPVKGRFRFRDYPALNNALKEIKKSLVRELRYSVSNAISAEWKASNQAADLLVKNYFTERILERVDGSQYSLYFQTNPDSLKAFQNRRVRGMNLRNRLWEIGGNFVTKCEESIELAVKNGTAARTLSDQLFERFANHHGLTAQYIRETGSAAKSMNVEYQCMRIARSEINIAYRTAENERWAQLDFVVGYEIHTSNTHGDNDMCDELAGRYPKEFKWTGWHPNCKCYKTAVLKTKEEFLNKSKTSKNAVQTYPPAFVQYVQEWRQTGRYVPYFIQDNRMIIEDIKNGRIQ